MHKSSKIKRKIDILKEKILLDDESFFNYYDNFLKLNEYPLFISNANLLKDFFEKVKSRYKVKYISGSFYNLNPEKIEVLLEYGYLNIKRESEFTFKMKFKQNVIKNVKTLKKLTDDYIFIDVKNLYKHLNNKKKSIRGYLLKNIDFDFLKDIDFYKRSSGYLINDDIFFILEKFPYPEVLSGLLKNMSMEDLRKAETLGINIKDVPLNYLITIKDESVFKYMFKLFTENNLFYLSMSLIKETIENKNFLDLSLLLKNLLYIKQKGGLRLIDKDILNNSENILFTLLSHSKDKEDVKFLKELLKNDFRIDLFNLPEKNKKFVKSVPWINDINVYLYMKEIAKEDLVYNLNRSISFKEVNDDFLSFIIEKDINFYPRKDMKKTIEKLKCKNPVVFDLFKNKIEVSGSNNDFEFLFDLYSCEEKWKYLKANSNKDLEDYNVLYYKNLTLKMFKYLIDIKKIKINYINLMNKLDAIHIEKIKFIFDKYPPKNKIEIKKLTLTPDIRKKIRIIIELTNNVIFNLSMNDNQRFFKSLFYDLDNIKNGQKIVKKFIELNTIDFYNMALNEKIDLFYYMNDEEDVIILSQILKLKDDEKLIAYMFYLINTLPMSSCFSKSFFNNSYVESEKLLSLIENNQFEKNDFFESEVVSPFEKLAVHYSYFKAEEIDKIINIWLKIFGKYKDNDFVINFVENSKNDLLKREYFKIISENEKGMLKNLYTEDENILRRKVRI